MASSVESTYPSLLQGVSQQTIRLRLDGQLDQQFNMLSDAVTSVRRRPAIPYVTGHDFGDLSNDPLFMMYIEKGTDGRFLIINTNSGQWFLLSKDLITIITQGTDEYFIAAGGRTSLDSTSIDLNTFIVNIEQEPQPVFDVDDKIDPTTAGYVFIKTGAFNTSYNVTVTNDGTTKTAEYNSPASGTAQISVSYIATQLATQLNSGTSFTATASGGVVAITGGTNLSVTAGTNSNYMETSNAANTQAVGNLAPRLPEIMDGFMMSVGSDKNSLVWYRWDFSKGSWVEDSAYGSVVRIENMPRQLTVLDTMEANPFEGRLAGDDETNADPAFIVNGIITGIATYQGRLALLSASFITLSKSNNPYRFYRGTISELLDEDRIDIGVGSKQNSIFRSAIQFNRDLILFGDNIQAVVTGGSNNLLTPKNAAISLTSDYACDSKIGAVPDGQTVLYPYKRSSKYSGLMELIPSVYTSSQYVSQDATAHIEEYIKGDIRILASSNATSMVTVCAEDLKTVYVHEYQWGSEGKIQTAWHKWEFPLNILGMVFAQERLIILGNDGVDETVYVTYLDARDGYDNQSAEPAPYLDLYTQVEVIDSKFVLPLHLQRLHTNGYSIVLARPEDNVIAEEIGIIDINTDTWECTTAAGVYNGTYYIGVRYESYIVPTPPLLRDEQGKVMGAGRVKLIHFQIAVQDTGAFKSTVTDKRTGANHTLIHSSVFLNSFDVIDDEPSVGSSGRIIIPCKTNADTTFVKISTDSVHNLNIIDISYLMRYAFNLRRV